MSRKNRRTRKFFADSKANVDTSKHASYDETREFIKACLGMPVKYSEAYVREMECIERGHSNY
jgi:hypothetical protein